MKRAARWKNILITSIAGFGIFELTVLWTQYQGLLGNMATGVLNIILLPVQIGSIVMLGLNLFLVLGEIPRLRQKMKLSERTNQLFAILIPVIQLLIIFFLLLLSTEDFCRALSFPADVFSLILPYSRQALVFLLPTTIIAAAIGFFFKKASLSTSLFSIMGIGFVGFIATNLATGMFGMPRLGDAMIIMIQPFAFLMPAIRMDMLILKKKKVEGKNMNTESGHHISVKSKIVAALLAFFVGGTGAHRYYLGYIKAGAVQTCGLISLIVGYALYSAGIYKNGRGIYGYESEGVMLVFFALVFLLFGLATEIWSFVDFVRILTGGLIPADGTSYTENSPQQVHVVNSAPSVNDNADALEKLAALHKQGVLTDEEFQKKKADILERM